METGKYSEKKVDFSKFDCEKFSPVLWNLSVYGLAGCGYNLLATLVGKENPYEIRKFNKSKNKESCDDKFIINYLRKNNFKILSLTQCRLSNHNESLLNGKILPSSNVIITSNLVKKNECSWFIGFQNYWIHNQEILPMKNLDLLNFPLISAYLIYHEKYK